MSIRVHHFYRFILNWCGLKGPRAFRRAKVKVSTVNNNIPAKKVLVWLKGVAVSFYNGMLSEQYLRHAERGYTRYEITESTSYGPGKEKPDPAILVWRSAILVLLDEALYKELDEYNNLLRHTLEYGGYCHKFVRSENIINISEMFQYGLHVRIIPKLST